MEKEEITAYIVDFCFGNSSEWERTERGCEKRTSHMYCLFKYFTHNYRDSDYICAFWCVLWAFFFLSLALLNYEAWEAYVRYSEFIFVLFRFGRFYGVEEVDKSASVLSLLIGLTGFSSFFFQQRGVLAFVWSLHLLVRTHTHLKWKMKNKT